MNPTYLAVDLGASSGRVLATQFDGKQLQLEEVHRFPNGSTAASGHLYWNVLGLWSNIQQGLRLAAERFGDSIVSVGIDTWGVDFALLGRDDQLLGNPFHYRDRQTDGILDYAFATMSREAIFEETGLQFMQINTLYQLLALKRRKSPVLDAASSFLMIPDYFHFLLTGEKASEFTDASTSQMVDPRTRDWSPKLLDAFQLNSELLQSIVMPGTELGGLRDEVREATRLSDRVKVVLPGTHDTASAVLAVPTTSDICEKPNWCYISSGTWSLMGVEVSEPVISDVCRQYNFTNEGGIGGSSRLLRNITGLWLVQECRRIWAREGNDLSWGELTELAEAASPLQALIHPDDPRFAAPTDMPSEIRKYCRETGQSVPDTEGAVIRCALESLALRYRQVLGWLETVTGGTIATIHVVGGGSQNEQLCRMTANACGRPVLAGPVEATAMGNIAMQAVASGQINSVLDAREVVAASIGLKHFEPTEPGPWDNAFERFLKLDA